MTSVPVIVPHVMVAGQESWGRAEQFVCSTLPSAVAVPWCAGSWQHREFSQCIICKWFIHLSCCRTFSRCSTFMVSLCWLQQHMCWKHICILAVHVYTVLQYPCTIARTCLTCKLLLIFFYYFFNLQTASLCSLLHCSTFFFHCSNA